MPAARITILDPPGGMLSILCERMAPEGLTNYPTITISAAADRDGLVDEKRR